MEKFFEKPKMKIIVISAASVLLLTIIIVTIACLNVAKKNNKADGDSDDDDSIGAFAQKTDDSSSEDPDNTPTDDINEELIFESNGDGSCSVVGLGSFEGTELIIPAESPNGDTVIAIADGAFEGCGTLEAISIPATVKNIGSGAFVNCSSLVSFNVSSQNTKYCAVSGVLFSKDKTTLVCYPPKRVGKSYLLSTNVRTISAYAFDSVEFLKTILYQGSTSKFYSIEVGTGNQTFDSLSVTCNYIPAK